MRQQTVFAAKLCSVLIVNNLFMEMAVSAPAFFGCTVVEINSRQCNTLSINSNSNISTIAPNIVNNTRAVENSQIIGDIPRIRKPELQIPNDVQVVNQVPLSSDRREITVTSASTGTEQVFLTSLPDAEKFELFGVEFKNISGIDLRPLLVGSGLNIDNDIAANLQQFKVRFANNAVSEISLADGSSAVFATGKIILRSPNGQEIETVQLTNTRLPHVDAVANGFGGENKGVNKSRLLAQNSFCKAIAQSSLENVLNDVIAKKTALQGSSSAQNSQILAIYSVALGFTSSMLSNQPASANLQETICKPPVQCDEQVVAGKSEIRTDLFQVPKNTTNTSVSLEYEFFNIPDKLEMLYDGKKIFEVGPTSGSDRKVFALPNTAKLVGVRVIGNSDKQTEWNYKISCSGDAIAQKPESESKPIQEKPKGTPLRYLAINLGNVGLKCWEAKLCDQKPVNNVNAYIARWQPDVIMLSEVFAQQQLKSSIVGIDPKNATPNPSKSVPGPILPAGYDGICGKSVNQNNTSASPYAEGASHEHECIAWKTSRVSLVRGSEKSEYGIDVPEVSIHVTGPGTVVGVPIPNRGPVPSFPVPTTGCNYDFTGFQTDLKLGNKYVFTAMAIHPQSGQLPANVNCRKEEIRRYWKSLANKRYVIIGGDWNTGAVKDEIKPPSNFKINYSQGQHWDITTHKGEYSVELGKGPVNYSRSHYDHAFSNFGTACTNCGKFYGTPDLPFGSAIGSNDSAGPDRHPRADGGDGMDHRQILVDMMIP